jgi:hypothetical protein
MLTLAIAIGLVLFFVGVLCLCLRYSKQDVDPRPDSYLEMTPSSPLGRWRY